MLLTHKKSDEKSNQSGKRDAFRFSDQFGFDFAQSASVESRSLNSLYKYFIFASVP